ncbi:NfeD family protein [Pseudoalteromonas tunicata]|uniref:Membrane protein n=1 Tax=Pseudoalteromonas tunicata D2 TaxID=87626 RepID=A4CE58_9GAMM|nr:NfeD family protein [Pseudoalteromonas tunicata]ATC93093.1 hypothetical protein PTUN_a0279 [Pseudoalteromonas tunicata]AXT32166.1 NfeD family protein [Pseudoalteromonas tunicata]EAR26870.1 membrane protein [Pseudoalteromonas tunicata D2]MDP4984674.1 NfeD family protein [Pseudoalteromonas tunicata]MDP5213592.1 NfeD family protein [Pseudoalteromonas tunicata]
MLELFTQIEAWHWLILGLLLLGAEALGTAGFLLGAAIAAFCIMLVKFALPELSWQWQMSLFAVLSVILSILYWKFFKRFNQQSDHKELNQRSHHLIGKEWVLSETITIGENHVQIGDTYWKVFSDQDIKAGSRVKVISADPMSLTIGTV